MEDGLVTSSNIPWIDRFMLLLSMLTLLNSAGSNISINEGWVCTCDFPIKNSKNSKALNIYQVKDSVTCSTFFMFSTLFIMSLIVIGVGFSIPLSHGCYMDWLALILSSGSLATVFLKKL
jgi:hypothetical protein